MLKQKLDLKKNMAQLQTILKQFQTILKQIRHLFLFPLFLEFNSVPSPNPQLPRNEALYFHTVVLLLPPTSLLIFLGSGWQVQQKQPQCMLGDRATTV